MGEAPAAESIVSFLMGQGNGDVLTWEASRKEILTPGAHEAHDIRKSTGFPIHGRVLEVRVACSVPLPE